MGDRTGPDVDRKARLKIPRQPFPKQDPESRVHNWNEVYLPIDLDLAKVEATRCIQCPAAPCIKACPVENDIPGALWKLEQGDVMGAAEVFHETSTLPEMCGRFCPQERLCEGHCVVGKKAPPVAIGRLEAFVADEYRTKGGYQIGSLPAPTGRRVAVVGAGPAGLAAAEELAKEGHDVTVFDAWPEPGGVLLYGIPNFKMEKELVDTKVAQLRKLGIQFVGDTHVGRDVTVDGLFDEGYHAVFLGHGAGRARRLELQGVDLPGIMMATEFLVRANLAPERLPEAMREPLTPGEKLLVVGGGDTAMDCVRTGVRLGSKEVTCTYRRTEAEQACREEERTHAREEGVRFEYLASPVRFDAGPDGRVSHAHLARMVLGEPDESGRRRPLPTGEEFIVRADTVVLAVGYLSDGSVPEGARVEHDDNLVIVERESGKTNRPGVFAGGDCVNGPDLVVTAVADGRRAAAAIHTYLTRQIEAVA